MTTDTASLEVSGLAFAYPDGHQALFGVDFRVARGERVALLGPNGAGKTTLVLHLNGILGGGVGSVKVAGLPVDKRHMAEIRRRVGIVFQDPDDQLFMPTVREDVAFGPAAAGLKGDELEARVRTALELCPRSLILSEGTIAADGKTAELLTDEELMRAHRLELPFGFDPRSVTMGA